MASASRRRAASSPRARGGGGVDEAQEIIGEIGRHGAARSERQTLPARGALKPVMHSFRSLLLLALCLCGGAFAHGPMDHETGSEDGGISTAAATWVETPTRVRPIAQIGLLPSRRQWSTWTHVRCSDLKVQPQNEIL